MNVNEDHDEITNALEQLGTLRVYNYIPDTPTPPSAIVLPRDWDYNTTYDDGTVDPMMTVLLLQPMTNAEAGQRALFTLISTGVEGSAVDAINTLCPNARVTRMQNFGVTTLQDGGTRYPSAELLVQLLD